MSDTSETILDHAERRMRLDGYNAVSFRQLAQDTGIKSASVHYHFPTKEDLGVAVVERYRRKFRDSLGDPADLDGAVARVGRFTDAFRRAKSEDGLICLCGMLGAESSGLPDAVKHAVSGFFEDCLTWLEQALETEDGPTMAAFILSALEGAMIIWNTTGDDALFDRACDQSVAAVTRN